MNAAATMQFGRCTQHPRVWCISAGPAALHRHQIAHKNHLCHPKCDDQDCLHLQHSRTQCYGKDCLSGGADRACHVVGQTTDWKHPAPRSLSSPHANSAPPPRVLIAELIAPSRSFGVQCLARWRTASRMTWPAGLKCLIEI